MNNSETWPRSHSRTMAKVAQPRTPNPSPSLCSLDDPYDSIVLHMIFSLGRQNLHASTYSNISEDHVSVTIDTHHMQVVTQLINMSFSRFFSCTKMLCV